MSTDAYTTKSADNFRMEASKLMLAPADGTYNLIKIPKFAFVTDAWVQIVTAFTGTASVEIGWFGNSQTAVTDGFITDDVADPTHVGMKRGFNTTTSTFPGKWFSAASGAITATVLDGTGAVGNFRVFVQFTVIHP
jgi:hypothetical protein